MRAGAGGSCRSARRSVQDEKSRGRARDGGRATWLAQHDLVDVAPHPAFARLERPHDRMGCRLEVLGGVLVDRAVAATDVATRQAHAQMDPGITGLQALLTPVRAWTNRPDLILVRARCHGRFLSAPRVAR